jgi:hypothetical protein
MEEEYSSSIPMVDARVDLPNREGASLIRTGGEQDKPHLRCSMKLR